MSADLALPCAFCGVERTNRWRHEKICPQRNGRPLPNRGTNPLKGLGGRQRLKELADQRARELFATVDVSDAWRIWAQLRERGYTRSQIKALVARARNLELIAPDVRIALTDLSAVQRAKFDEKIRELFKRGVDLDAPLRHTIRQHPDIGLNEHSVDHISKRAKHLGLVPPGFRFRTRQMPNPEATAEWRREYDRKRREGRPPREARPKREATKLPPNAVPRPAATVDLGFSTGTRAKPAKHLVTRSALDGDAIRPRCPNSGCDWEGNTFRLRRHLADECPYRDEEDEAS